MSVFSQFQFGKFYSDVFSNAFIHPWATNLLLLLPFFGFLESCVGFTLEPKYLKPKNKI